MRIGVIVISLFLFGFYVYASLVWYTPAKKLKYKNPWLGWIALFIIGIIAKWEIFKKIKYPGWFSLAIIIPEIGGILYLISIGFLAWGKKK